MPDLATQITKAKQAGYSDADITAYLGQDSTLAPKIAEAKSHGYADAEIIGHLSGATSKPADPAYTKARTASDAAEKHFGFADAVTSNLGVRDEMAGGINYLLQGADNLGRRITGRPIEVPASTAYRAGADASDDAAKTFAAAHPVQNAFATVGGIAASGAPLKGALAGPVSALKSGATAAIANAPLALARQKGDLQDRLPGAALETGLAFGMGSTLQAGANVLGRAAAAAKAAPLSAARQLSQEGVDLTPGQMAGGVLKRGEDMLTSAPLTGASINAARKRGLETFDRAAINRALTPIGQAIGKDVNVGREGVQVAQQRVSQAYDSALGGVKVAPDQQFVQEIHQVLSDPRYQAVSGDLKAEIDNLATRFNGAIDGPAWKAIDEDLGKAANDVRAGKSTDRFLKEAIGGLQDAFQGVLQRTNPKAAADVAKADEAYANLVRIEKAAGGIGAKDGVFTAPQLQSAVRASDQSTRKRGFAAGNALMQDLSEAGAKVLPNNIPDSGTALRVAGLGGLGALGSAGAGAHGAATVIGADLLGAAAYSKPAMAALNAVYRASTPGAARQALATLGTLAARDPALAPAYRAAAEKLGVQLPRASGQPNALAPQQQSMTR